MTKVVLDAETRAKLHGLSRPLAVFDDAGKLIGITLPPDDARAWIAGKDFAPFTADEMLATLSDPRPGRPLEDILAEAERS